MFLFFCRNYNEDEDQKIENDIRCENNDQENSASATDCEHADRFHLLGHHLSSDTFHLRRCKHPRRTGGNHYGGAGYPRFNPQDTAGLLCECHRRKESIHHQFHPSPVPHLYISNTSSHIDLLIGGFFLGIGGAMFSVGVTSLPKYYPKEKHGLI